MKKSDGYSFALGETCSTYVRCTAFHNYAKELNAALQEAEEEGFSKNFPKKSDWKVDESGFSWCAYCDRIYRETFAQKLVQCPTCSRFFRGPRREMPIDYECKNC